MKRKLLSLIMAFTMIVGMVTTSSVALATEGVEKIGRDVVFEAAELLMTLNIVKGYEDGSLGLEKNITRAEFASMIARMLQGTDELNLNAGAIVHDKMSETPENIEAVKEAKESGLIAWSGFGMENLSVGAKSYRIDIDSTDLADSAYSDITNSHWAYSDIDYLRGQGIVSGYSDGTFKPDNNILYEEAVKFVVSALGYDFMGVSYGGYPDGYINTATRLGLLKNVDGSRGVEMTRQQIMVLLYNSLTVDYLVIEGVSGQDKVYESGKNILNYVFGIDVIDKCYVVANENTGIDSVYDATDKGTLEIATESGVSGVVFKYFNESYKELLGYRVKAYVKFDEEDEDRGELYCMFPTAQTKKITVKSKDVIDADVNDNLLEVYIGEDETELKLADEPDVIYNGIAYAKKINNEIFDLESGDITLISTNGTKVYDLIYINEYIPMYVENVKSNTKTIKGISYFDHSVHEDYTLCLDEDKDYEAGKEIKVDIIRADGTEGDFSDIKVNSVIYVRMWANHYKVNIGTNAINGTVSKKGSGYVVIGETKYEEIEDSGILAEHKKGSSLKIAVDKDGYVFYAKANAGLAALNYGLLMDIAVDDKSDAFSDVVVVKLMDTHSNKKVYKLAENMKFTDMGTATYRLSDDGKENSITAEQLFVMLEKSAKYASLQNGTEYAHASSYRPYEQLIKYALNADGEIKEIVTAMPSSQVPEKEDKSAYFTFEDVNVSNRDINNGGISGAPYMVDGVTMFRVSKNANSKDDEYNVTSWGLGARAGMHAHVLFDVGEDGRVAAIVSGNDATTGSTSADEFATYMMVEYIQDSVLDFQGEAEFGYELGFINNGSYQTKYAIESTKYGYGYLGHLDYNIGDVTNPHYWSSGHWFNNYVGTFSSVEGTLTFENDPDKNVNIKFFPIKGVLSRIIDGSSDMYIHGGDGANTWGSWEREVTFGKVRKVAGDNVIIEYGKGTADAIVCTIEGKKAASYDCGTGYVRVVDATEVAEGDWVLLQQTNKAFKAMFIYTNVEEADLDNIKRYENKRK